MLEGKVGLVTGAGQGIGRRIALELARQGASAAVVADLDVANAEETAALVREAGAGAEAIEVNLRDRGQIEAMVAHASQSFDGLDLLFNNAGVIETSLSDECAVDTLPEDAWDAVYEVNLKAVWLTTKFAAPHLKRSTRGPAIVNTASVAGLTGFANAAVYGTTKDGVIHLTKVTAIDLAPVRCKLLCAGRDRDTAHPSIPGQGRGPRGVRRSDARAPVDQPDGQGRGSRKTRLLPRLRRCRVHHRRRVPDRRRCALVDGSPTPTDC